MKKWAIIDDGIVVNVVFWDGESAWSVENESDLIELPPSIDGYSDPGIGWSYSNGKFLPIINSDNDTPLSED